MYLNMKLIHPHAKAFRRYPGDAGYDIFACEDTTIDPLSRKLIKVGVKTEFSEEYVGQINDRSGHAVKGVTVFGGVIDSSYRGEWGVILYNSTGQGFDIKTGDKIAQVLFLPVGLPEITVVDGELAESNRGEKGFGSSGR